MRELDLIRWIRERSPSAPGVQTGIGDDAAVLSTAGGGCVVVTTDLLVEGTHFLTDAAPREIGHKALAVSVSDIAAMGCRAIGAVIAVALRTDLGEAWAKSLFEGIAAAARKSHVALVGGDTTETGGPVSICSTVLGEPPEGRGPVLRSGARPGQALLVTGELGGSLRGRHLRFTPRQAESLELVERTRPGAMIDLSDGLSTDAWHLARESGVRLRIHPDLVPISDAARDAADPLMSALNDGEDFELLFTTTPEAAEEIVRSGLAGTRVTRIGEIAEGEPEVLLARPDGSETPVPAGGWEHFHGA